MVPPPLRYVNFYEKALTLYSGFPIAHSADRQPSSDPVDENRQPADQPSDPVDENRQPAEQVFNQPVDENRQSAAVPSADGMALKVEHDESINVHVPDADSSRGGVQVNQPNEMPFEEHGDYVDPRQVLQLKLEPDEAEDDAHANDDSRGECFSFLFTIFFQPKI